MADSWLVTLANIREKKTALEKENAELKTKLRKEENLHNQTCDERDAFHEWADKLAEAIAPFEVRGEHSNGNNPWANALDYVRKL